VITIDQATPTTDREIGVGHTRVGAEPEPETAHDQQHEQPAHRTYRTIAIADHGTLQQTPEANSETQPPIAAGNLVVALLLLPLQHRVRMFVIAAGTQGRRKLIIRRGAVTPHRLPQPTHTALDSGIIVERELRTQRVVLKILHLDQTAGGPHRRVVVEIDT